jgi:nucleoside-diphosphate-sugar epimerase
MTITMVENELHTVLGSGPLGLSVARELLARGKRVRMVNRGGKAPAGVATAAEFVGADLYNPQDVTRVTQGAAAVYQCAQPHYWEWPQKFPPLQASIVDGVAATGAKLVVGENLYMYGEVKGPIHEGLPYAAQTRKGRVRAAMSEALLDAHRAGKVRVAIGRGSDFFGPFALDSGLGDRAFLPALQGKAAQTAGDPDALHTYTFIDDFGKALVVLGERDEALGQAWHVPNPETLTTRQVVDLIFQEIGQPAKLSTMGKMMMRIGGIFIPGAREMVEMMYEFEKPFVVDSSKFTKAFGIEATPWKAALHETVAWFKQYAATQEKK